MSFAFSVRRAAFAVSAGAAILAISGCGGGGSSGPGGGTSTNRAPQISSATTATLTENSAAAALVLAASDPDGDAVTFAISGGGIEHSIPAGAGLWALHGQRY